MKRGEGFRGKKARSSYTIFLEENKRAEKNL
jgi:hypothetical protein